MHHNLSCVCALLATVSLLRAETAPIEFVGEKSINDPAGSTLLLGEGTVSTPLPGNERLTFQYLLPADAAGKPLPTAARLVFYAPHIREPRDSIIKRDFLRAIPAGGQVGVFTVAIKHGAETVRYAYADTGWFPQVFAMRTAILRQHRLNEQAPFAVLGESAGGNMVHELVQRHADRFVAAALVGGTIWGERPEARSLPFFVGYTAGDDGLRDALPWLRAWDAAKVPYLAMVGPPDPARRGTKNYGHSCHPRLLQSAARFVEGYLSGRTGGTVPLDSTGMATLANLDRRDALGELVPETDIPLLGPHHGVLVPAEIAGWPSVTERQRGATIEVTVRLPEAPALLYLHVSDAIDLPDRRENLLGMIAQGYAPIARWWLRGEQPDLADLPSLTMPTVIASDRLDAAMGASRTWMRRAPSGRQLLMVRQRQSVALPADGVLPAGSMVAWLHGEPVAVPVRYVAPSARATRDQLGERYEARLLAEQGAATVQDALAEERRRLPVAEAALTAAEEKATAVPGAKTTVAKDVRDALAKAKQDVKRIKDRLVRLERDAKTAAGKLAQSRKAGWQLAMTLAALPFRRAAGEDGVVEIPYVQVDTQWRMAMELVDPWIRGATVAVCEVPVAQELLMGWSEPVPGVP